MKFPWRRAAAPFATELAAQASEGVSLEDSYELCRRVNQRHSSTFYWSTRILPKVKQHHVHALYAFCRYADEIVDAPSPVDAREKSLGEFGDRFFDDVQLGRSNDPVLKAVVHTIRAFDIDPDCCRRFLRAMALDLSVFTYETWDDLLVYMDGAAGISEMLLPILEPTDPGAKAHARDLGNAFQLTNLLRDMSEDLDRGRVYLPQADLRRYDADPVDERRRVRAGEPVSEQWTALMRYEIGRCRNLYVSADIGIGLLPDSSARCIRAARVLYSRILDLIEARGCDVFTTRISVPAWQQAALTGKALYGPS